VSGRQLLTQRLRRCRQQEGNASTAPCGAEQLRLQAAATLRQVKLVYQGLRPDIETRPAENGRKSRRTTLVVFLREKGDATDVALGRRGKALLLSRAGGQQEQQKAETRSQ
jgi:hypothetical protein